MAKMSGSTWQYIGLGALGIATAAVVGYAALPSVAPQPSPTSIITPLATPSTTAPIVLPTAVFIGDSYTVGAGASSPASGWAQVTARTLGWTPVVSADSSSGYITKGKNGTLTADQIANAAPDKTPTFVVIASGYNDTASDPKLLAGAIAGDLDAAKAKWPQAKIVVLGPWAPNNTVNSNQATTDALLKDATTERGIAFVDPIAEKWFEAANIIGPDKLHPNDSGHRIIGTRAAEAFKAALKL